MSEHQPEASNGDREVPGIESLAVSSDDPEVHTRWRFCLDRWGEAFVAFSHLRLTELYTDDVVETFENLYGGSYDDLTQAAIEQIDALGWKDALYKLRRDEGITDDLLEWNYRAVIDRLGDIYTFVRVGGRVHFFAK
jgi:hypothetical protein